MKEVTTYIYGAEPVNCDYYSVVIDGKAEAVCVTWKEAQRWYASFLGFGNPKVYAFNVKEGLKEKLERALTNKVSFDSLEGYSQGL